MTKRVFAMRILAVLLAVLAIVAAYCAGYAHGNLWRFKDVTAWSGDWTWYANTENGPAYVLDTGMDYDAEGRWISFGEGYDGTINLEIDGEWHEIPLYVW